MPEQYYTLTEWAGISGPDYQYSRGDILTEEQWSSLPATHRGGFTKGRIDLKATDGNPKSEGEREIITELQSQVDKLEKRVQKLEKQSKEKSTEEK